MLGLYLYFFGIFNLKLWNLKITIEVYKINNYKIVIILFKME